MLATPFYDIYYVTFLSIGEGEFTFMGEALMFRAGGGSFGGNDDPNAGYEFCTNIFTSNGTFTMPEGVKDNQVHVRIFGGGGYGNSIGGGGGGWMNNGWVELGSGSTIPVTIGQGGYYKLFGGSSTTTGGITSFGTYLSANGGTSSSGNDGGSGGSGGGAGFNSAGEEANARAAGGTGYQFGGGAGHSDNRNINNYFGKGGPMGGNGGILGGYFSDSRTGSNLINAKDGINTIGVIEETDLVNVAGIGYGKAGVAVGSGVKYYCGGGGYGANGGGVTTPTMSNVTGSWSNGRGFGGGGGYGNAGYGGSGTFNRHYQSSTWGEYFYYYGGGGGAYGHGGTYSLENPTYGGGGANGQNGANGICIVHYYKKT